MMVFARYNPLPNDKILDWSKSKAFAHDKINVNEIWLGKGRKHCGERRKCWLLARIVKSQDCVVRSASRRGVTRIVFVLRTPKACTSVSGGEHERGCSGGLLRENFSI